MKLVDIVGDPNKPDLGKYYLAFVISEGSRTELLKKFPPKFSKVVCHHVTIEFNLSKKHVEELKERPELNGSVEVGIYGIADGDGVQCLLAQLGPSYERGRRDGSFYHVTLSVEPPHTPYESNKIPHDKFAFIKGPAIKVEGSLELVKK